MKTSAPRELPPTTLIICSRNRPQLLLETLASVLKGNEVPTELIVIDQSDAPNATLASMKSDRHCEVRYLPTRSIGLSRGRNTGIAEARYDLVAIIDDDMLAEPSWFQVLIGRLSDAGERAVVTGRVLAATAEVPGGFVPAVVSSTVPAVYEGRIGTDVLAGGHMATFRSVLQKVGGFDERLGPGSHFPAAEDNDLGFRLLEIGCPIFYVPDAVVHHRAWRQKSEYLRIRWRYGLGKGGFYTKHLSFTDRYMFRRMGWDIWHRLVRSPRRIAAAPRQTVGDLFYIGGIIVGAIRWLITQGRQNDPPRVLTVGQNQSGADAE
jgi:GT2 family glycosyltransferase